MVKNIGMQTTSKVAKNFSDDKLIFSGMTLEEAYNDTKKFNAFKAADKNGDKVIDDWEVDRYNGPMVVKNYKKQSAIFVGHCGHHNVYGAVITDDEQDFYPGLKLSECKNIALDDFKYIDKNGDKIVSKKEILLYMIEEKKKQLNEILNASKSSKYVLGGGASIFTGAVGAAWGSTGLAALGLAGSALTVSTAGIGIIVAAGVAYGLYEFDKYETNNSPEVLNLKQEIKNLEAELEKLN